MSGTIVERRDQVFTTFFSLRVFSASTLSRKWPSTNGPFFVERAIASLFLHAAQTPPLGVPHLLETPHRTRNTVRPRTERANKTRAQSIGCPIHNHRPAGFAQLVQHRLEWHDNFHRGLACQSRLSGHFRRQSFYRSLHRPRPASCSACRTCTCCSHFSALPSQPLLAPACRRQASRELRLPSCLPWALSFRIAPRPLRTPVVPGAEPEAPFLLRPSHPTNYRERRRKISFTSGAPQSCDRCAYCHASSCRASGKPTAFAGDCP